MSSSRIKFDNNAFDLQINRSIGPGDYMLYRGYGENDNPCYSYDGPIGSKDDVSVGDMKMPRPGEYMTEIESELTWRSRPLTKSNLNSTPINKYKLYNKNVCPNILQIEDTRFTHPIDNYRGMSLTEYQYEPYLHVNPQCVIQESTDRIGLNSRLVIKDNYSIPNQEFWDNGDGFPKETNIKIEMPICRCSN
jgi:hypothetical protein